MVWSPGHSKGFGQVFNGEMFATMGMPFINGNNHMSVCQLLKFACLHIIQSTMKVKWQIF